MSAFGKWGRAKFRRGRAMRAHYAMSDRPIRCGCVVAALALFGSAGCSEAPTEQREGPVSVSITPYDLSLFVNDVATLTADALDAKRQRIDRTFIWSSANPAVATVSSAGELLVKYNRSDREAAHLFALANMAAFDVATACFDAKFAYFFIRPSQPMRRSSSQSACPIIRRIRAPTPASRPRTRP